MRLGCWRRTVGIGAVLLALASSVPEGASGAEKTGGAAVAAFVRLLEDENPDTRARAIWALADLKAQGSAGKIAELLDDPEPQVRTTAANALGSMRAKGYNDVLTECLAGNGRAIQVQEVSNRPQQGFQSACIVEVFHQIPITRGTNVRDDRCLTG